MYARMNTNGDTNINLDELEKELEKNFDNVSISKKGANEALPWIVTSNGYMFEITETGEVTRINGIALDKSNIKLIQGGTETITAELTQGVTGTITWTSNNDKVTVTGNDKTAQIEVKENATGTATITAKIEGTEYSATCKVNVVSKVESISVDNIKIGVEEEKEIKIKTTPSDNVEELTYTYKVVANPDVVTVVDNSEKAKGLKIGKSTIEITGIGKLSKKQVTAQCEVEVIKQLISVTAEQIAANPKAYYGKKVENYKVSEEDTNTYRIFYIDTEGRFGEKNKVYLTANTNISSVVGTDYTTETKVKEMNPMWANGITSDSDVTTRGDSESNWNTNEKAAAYLCSPVNANNKSDTELPWKKYFNADYADYAIGAPSVEMYVKSFNQYTSTTNLSVEYSKTNYPGYIYKVDGEKQNDGFETNPGTIFINEDLNSIYESGYWWLSSPNSEKEYSVCYVYGSSAYLTCNYYRADSLQSSGCKENPLISLKSNFEIKIEK